jgi:hypothetical protein
MKTIWIYLLLLAIGLNLIGCSDKIEAAPSYDFPRQFQAVTAGKIAEVAPPSTIQELSDRLQQYEPQVEILSPKGDRIFKENQVSVKLQVKNLPIFKDSELEMGPHLHLILDNEPERSIYDLDNPVILENLAPGSHTIRVFAVRPWNESFKNEGAYTQTTFHILTKTPGNNPDPSQPLITYNSPSGIYGAEPILLDFYLTNAPLHLVAKEDPDFKDWRIRVTVNDESFIFDRWQAIYLKGFEKGNNWLQLELIDEDGKNINNVFNNTVRLITYDPKQKDTLSKLVRDKLSTNVARAIVEPSYIAKPIPIPPTEVAPKPEPEIIPEPEIKTPGAIEENPKVKIEIKTPDAIEENPKTKIEVTKPETIKENPKVKIEIKTPDAIEENLKANTKPVEEPKIDTSANSKTSVPELTQPEPEKIEATETDIEVNEIEKTPTTFDREQKEEKTTTGSQKAESPQWVRGLQDRWQQVKQKVSSSVSQIEIPKIELPKSRSFE